MNYPKLVRLLIAELRATRQEMAEVEDELLVWKQGAQEAAEWAEERESQRIAKAERDACNAEYERREAEHRRWAEEDRLRQLGRRLEVARSWGDNYEVDRIQRELKRGW